MTEAICENRSRDFFKEMKKLNPKVCVAPSIDGYVESSDIVKFFIMIIRYKDKLQTSDMHFAFKEKHSIAMCSLVVKEVIHYYIDNKSDAYSCCVYMSKDFDWVHHDKLFQLLIEHKVLAIAL